MSQRSCDVRGRATPLRALLDEWQKDARRIAHDSLQATPESASEYVRAAAHRRRVRLSDRAAQRIRSAQAEHGAAIGDHIPCQIVRAAALRFPQPKDKVAGTRDERSVILSCP